MTYVTEDELLIVVAPHYFGEGVDRRLRLYLTIADKLQERIAIALGDYLGIWEQQVHKIFD